MRAKAHVMVQRRWRLHGRGARAWPWSPCKRQFCPPACVQLERLAFHEPLSCIKSFRTLFKHGERRSSGRRSIGRLRHQQVVRGHRQPAGRKAAQLAREARGVLEHERRRRGLHHRAPLPDTMAANSSLRQAGRLAADQCCAWRPAAACLCHAPLVPAARHEARPSSTRARDPPPNLCNNTFCTQLPHGKTCCSLNFKIPHRLAPYTSGRAPQPRAGPARPAARPRRRAAWPAAAARPARRRPAAAAPAARAAARPRPPGAPPAPPAAAWRAGGAGGSVAGNRDQLAAVKSRLKSVAGDRNQAAAVKSRPKSVAGDTTKQPLFCVKA